MINWQWLLQSEKFLDTVICPEKVSGGEEKKKNRERKKEQIQVFNQILVLGLDRIVLGGIEYVAAQALHLKKLDSESVLITEK